MKLTLCYIRQTSNGVNGGDQKLNKAERYELRQQEKEQDKNVKNRNRFMKRVLLWGIVFVCIGGAIWGMAYFVKNSSFSTASLIDAVTPSDWIRGAHDGKVVLVEYSDFQCPACSRYEPLLRELLQEFGGKLEFVYRYFPLRQIHVNANLSAYAAEAAGRQEKFWEMHDMIFDHQDDWADASAARNIFLGYASDLRLDIEKFKTDLGLKDVADKVEKDYQGGLRAGVNSTPTFYLNGQKISNPRSYAEFQTIINQAIAANP